MDRAKSGDFVYFDPPYIPVSDTANFTSYQADGFTYIDQIMLRDVARQLSERGVYVMLSNSAAPLVRELYGDNFFLSEIKARRNVNRDHTKRGKVGEYLITNYPIGDVAFS
jgi:DNA adenine methylase